MIAQIARNSSCADLSLSFSLSLSLARSLSDCGPSLSSRPPATQCHALQGNITNFNKKASSVMKMV
jgi:hypothetical protein